MKKAISLLLTACMVVSLCATFATTICATSPEIWNGTNATFVAGNFAGGDGTEANPYLIATPTQLSMLHGGAYAAGKFFKLTNDIYLNDISTFDTNWSNESWRSANLHAWTPIDTLRGGFDGDGHTIYGLYLVAANAKTGLFSDVRGYAVVKNLNLGKGLVTGTFARGTAQTEGVGSLIGWIPNDRDTDVMIQNCHSAVNIDISVNLANGDYYNGIGGLIGTGVYKKDNAKETIQNCSYTGFIKVHNIGEGSVLAVGGIIGHVSVMQSTQRCTISGCKNYGDITVTKEESKNNSKGIGGIVGEIGYGATAGTVNISNCYNCGTITSDIASGANTGGIVGFYRNGPLTLEKCFNFGHISGTWGRGLITAWVGFTINNCYYTNAAIEYDLQAGQTITGSAPIRMEFEELGAKIRHYWTEFYKNDEKIAEGQALLYGFTFASDLLQKDYGYKLGVIFGKDADLTWENKKTNLEIKHGTYSSETKITDFSGYLIGIGLANLSVEYSARAYLMDEAGNIVLYSDVLTRSVNGTAVAAGGSLDASGNYVGGNLEVIS